MEYGARTRLVELLETATQPHMQAVHAETFKSAKALLRVSDENVRSAHELLLFKLKDSNSQVRYLALLLVDEIFRRSALFRGLLVPALETFLELTVGTRTDKPLPDPRAAAKRLQKKAIEVVERWNAEFGSRHRQVRLAYKYLRDVLRIRFPNLPQRALEAERARRDAERTVQEEQAAKFRQLEEEWGGAKAEVQALLRQLDECVALLKGGQGRGGNQGQTPLEPGHDLDTGLDGDVVERTGLYAGWEESGSGRVIETAENAAVVESVRDVYRALCQRHLKASQGWLTTLMRGGAPPQPQRRTAHEALLGEVVALRNEMLAAKVRCEALGVELRKRRADADEGEDDELWEEGEVPQGDPPAAQHEEEDTEEARERQALGLVAADDAAAGGAGLPDAVRNLLGALPSATGTEGGESEAWVPPQSNLVLKPGGRGLVRTEAPLLTGKGGGVGSSTTKRKEDKVNGRPSAAGHGHHAGGAKSSQPSIQSGPAAWTETEAIEMEPPEAEADGPLAEAPTRTASEKGGRRGGGQVGPRSGPELGPKPTSQRPGAPEGAAGLPRDPTRPKEGRQAQGPLAGASSSKAGAPTSAITAAPSSRTGAPLEALRASAPVVPWGAYLDHWGAEGAVPVDARGLVIENHWGPVDREATLPAERLREMGLRASYYQPEKKEIKACRAPLPGGGLCPRRDLVRCPLHGPVIPRDEQGRPVAQFSGEEASAAAHRGAAPAASPRQPLVTSADIERDIEGSATVATADGAVKASGESSPEAGAVREQQEVLQSAARQAVENVRKRGREEAEQRRGARQRGGVSAQERLRDRAHNEAVLREAAVRGSVQRLGEELGGNAAGEAAGGGTDAAQGADSATGGKGSERRRARGGGRAGAAQLTPRQRIERRLLSARVRNSTTSYLESEESRRIQTMNANRWENR